MQKNFLLFVIRLLSISLISSSIIPANAEGKTSIFHKISDSIKYPFHSAVKASGWDGTPSKFSGQVEPTKSISAQSQYDIPAWVKGVAGFWAAGNISDADFGEGLSFLIDSGIIKVPKIQELENENSQLKAENSELRDKLSSKSFDDGDE